MNLVIRCNYGDESIALLQWLHENKVLRAELAQFTKIYICYIDTGWAAQSWEAQVAQGEAFARSVGFVPVRLKAPQSFETLCTSRGSFPSQKFQWCAGFLKGVPFLEWLDERDSACEWVVALPKRQALYRTSIPEYIEQCEYHGERLVWHPILSLTQLQRDKLITRANFTILNHTSLECAPCVNSTTAELKMLADNDIKKACVLEAKLQQNFNQHHQAITERVAAAKNQTVSRTSSMDSFSMGCGDPFGCGL
tara:strand:+ start:122206 stop:122961 length:756 start_codon:yes stop_codon:yes gene_type:complete